MKADPTLRLELLKAAFCSGQSEALREIMYLSFPEIFLKMNKGTAIEQATEIYLLEYEIKENPSDFCESTLPTRQYIREKWKKRTARTANKETSFDEQYMSPTEVETPEEDLTSDQTLAPLPFHYFLSSLAPIDRLFFEVKYVQLLENRNGYFLVFQFLLNSTAIGNDELTKVLQTYPALAEPMIPDFLLDQALAAFIANYKLKTQLTLTGVLQQLHQKNATTKKDFVKICHAREVAVSRMFREFKNELKHSNSLTPLELALYFANKYLPTENHMELWLRLQLDALKDKKVEDEMKSLKLWNPNFLEKHALLRRNAIMERAAIGRKEEQKIIAIFKTIQHNIDTKLNKPTTWKTI